MADEKEPKAAAALELTVKFNETEAAWLKSEAGKGTPINVVIRQCVVKAMEAQIAAELAPIGPPPSQVSAFAPTAAKPAAAVNPAEKLDNGFLNTPELLAFYSWCANQTHHVGAAELANILYKYVRGENIDARVPQPVTNFSAGGR